MEKHDSRFYWAAKNFLVAPTANMVFRPWVKGRANVPQTGGAILASNHLSFSDSIFMPSQLNRQVHFLAKSEYFNGSGVRGWATRKFFHYSNQLPMDRSGGQASLNSLQAGLDLLEDGGLLGIYPEGTRSPDGRLYRGRIGLAKLALATGAPVIPIAMIGTDKVQPIDRKVPKIRRVGVIFGAPMHFGRDETAATGQHQQLREITDEVMDSIRRLSGQEYVDAYSPKKSSKKKSG